MTFKNSLINIFLSIIIISPTVAEDANNKNITYMQILQNPNDLNLNLKYAQQEGKIGNFKQTISTLERLIMLYPDNIEIKLYLLSILVQTDSPEKAINIIEEIKLRKDVSQEDLESVIEIENELKGRSEPKLWNFSTDISLGAVYTDNSNSVSKSRKQMSSDSVIGFNTAKYDSTVNGSLGLTATRSVGEDTSFMINLSHTESKQDVENDDDYENYGLTFALDTYIGNQSLSPYLILSKSDYQHDADSFSYMYGIGGYFSVGEKNTFSYGYSYSDSKANRNTSDTLARDTNAEAHGFIFGHEYIFNELISTSIGLGYSDSDAVVAAGNDVESYDLSLRFNFAFPWASLSIGDAVSINEYGVADTSISSNLIRSDVTNTFDIVLTKAVGDIFPSIDPNRGIFVTLSYEKMISEANILNYDYITDSFSLGISKSIKLN